MFIIINDTPADVLSLRRRLYRVAIHTTVLSPTDIDRIGDYPAHGVYIHFPEKMIDIDALCQEIKRKYPNLPLGLTYRPNGKNYYIYKRMVDAVFEEKMTAGTIVSTMYRIYEDLNHTNADVIIHRSLATYRRYPNFIFALTYHFPFSREQYMMTRYLLYKAPQAVSTAELAETCLPPGGRKTARYISAALKEVDALFLRIFGIQFFEYSRANGYRIHERVVDPNVDFM